MWWSSLRALPQAPVVFGPDKHSVLVSGALFEHLDVIDVLVHHRATTRSLSRKMSQYLGCFLFEIVLLFCLFSRIEIDDFFECPVARCT